MGVRLRSLSLRLRPRRRRVYIGGRWFLSSRVGIAMRYPVWCGVDDPSDNRSFLLRRLPVM